MKALAEELRNSVFRAMPIAQERVDLKNRAIVYGLGSLGANLCAIEIGEDSVKVRFVTGSRLADPERLLEGSEGEARTITMGIQEKIRSEPFERLVAQAFVMNAG